MAEYPGTSDHKTPRLVDEEGSVARTSTQLSLRVWCIDPEFVSWSCESVAIHLIADLVTASGGHLEPESREPLIARFDRQEAAVVAARRVQKALHAFTETTETQGFAASIAIYRPEDQIGVGTEWDLVDPLSQSTPGQILVSETVYETLQFVPGLRFRPPADPLVGKGAAEELLWTDDETLAAWQNRVDVAANALRREPSDSNPKGVTEPQLAKSVACVSSNEFRDTEFRAPSIASFRKKRMWLVSGSLAVIVVFTAVGFLTRPHQETMVVFQPPPLNPPHIDDRPGSLRHDPDHRIAEVDTIKEKPATRPPREYKGFTIKDVPGLLRKADRDSGAGKYGDARDEYDIVLTLAPGNADAQQGMRKLVLKMGEKQ